MINDKRLFIRNILLFLVVFLLLKITLNVRICKIEQQSMFPTLENGQWTLTINDSVLFDISINRGSIVTFRRDYICGSNLLVKRVIGMPGDNIKIENGEVFVNGVDISEPYLLFPNVKSEHVVLTVPRDKYFVMGDNRPYSYDSRHFGCINKIQIVGKVVWQ